jgi:hypothetical protein
MVLNLELYSAYNLSSLIQRKRQWIASLYTKLEGYFFQHGLKENQMPILNNPAIEFQAIFVSKKLSLKTDQAFKILEAICKKKRM